MQLATCLLPALLSVLHQLAQLREASVWAHETSDNQKNLICYYDGVSVASRPAVGSLAVDNIDASLCTHIIYR